MNYQKLINSNIKALRQSLHLTQEEFAEKTGMSIQGLSNIERNRYQPTAETVDKICRTFNITPAELLLEKISNDNEIIKNIEILLSQTSNRKLQKIYEIIKIMVKI